MMGMHIDSVFGKNAFIQFCLWRLLFNLQKLMHLLIC